MLWLILFLSIVNLALGFALALYLGAAHWPWRIVRSVDLPPATNSATTEKTSSTEGVEGTEQSEQCSNESDTKQDIDSDEEIVEHNEASTSTDTNSDSMSEGAAQPTHDTTTEDETLEEIEAFRSQLSPPADESKDRQQTAVPIES